MAEFRDSAAQHTDLLAQIARALQRSFVFQDLSAAELTPLAESSRRIGLAPGEHAFFVGDHASALYVVEHGQLKEYVISDDGQEMITDIFAPPSVFGEPALFVAKRIRAGNVAAMMPSVIIAIPRGDLVSFLHIHQPAMERMLENLSAMAREVVHVAAGLAFDRIVDRLGLKLAELAENFGAADPRGTRIILKLSQSTLASAIAATRPNVNRAIRQLVDAGELIVDGNELIVRNPQRLRAAIAPGRPPRTERNPNRAAGDTL